MNFSRCIIPCLIAVLLVFLGGCASRTTPTQSAASQKELPNFHYAFAHKYLHRKLYAEPQLGLALTFLKDRQDLLLALWNNCREYAPKWKANDNPAGLTVEGGKIADNIAMAIITMPRPQDITETYYICVITTFTVDGDGKMHAKGISYYTLEASIGLYPVIGSWDKDSNHLNYGKGPAPDSPKDFVFAVLKLYASALSR